MTCTKTAVCVISFSILNNNQVLGVHSTGQHSMISSAMCPHLFASKSMVFWRQRSNTDYDISYLKKHSEQIIPAMQVKYLLCTYGSEDVLRSSALQAQPADLPLMCRPPTWAALGPDLIKARILLCLNLTWADGEGWIWFFFHRPWLLLFKSWCFYAISA